MVCAELLIKITTTESTHTQTYQYFIQFYPLVNLNKGRTKRIEE